MPKINTQNAKIIRATLDVAARKDWLRVTLGDIAKEAKIPLCELKKRFASPNDIIPKIVEKIEREALRKSGKTAAPLRDVLHDLINARFDVMQQDRNAILAINDAMRSDPSLSYILVHSIMGSLRKMLYAKKLGKTLSSVPVIEASTIYGWTFLAWSKDNTRTLSKTKTALDEALKDFEIRLESSDNAFNAG